MLAHAHAHAHSGPWRLQQVVRQNVPAVARQERDCERALVLSVCVGVGGGVAAAVVVVVVVVKVAVV